MQEPHDVSALLALDLNLLVVLDALLVERSVTRAAARLGRSQPAISHALARLRESLADPLLVRGPGALVPTPRAEALAEPLASALGTLAASLAPEKPFDAATSRRRFTLATIDYVDLVLVPPLLARIGEVAPGVDLRLRPAPADRLGELMDGSDVDLVIGVERTVALGRSIRRRSLFDESFVCIVRSGHPKVKRKLSLEIFCALPHLLIAPRGRPGGPVDEALARLGLPPRRVALMLSTFAAAPAIVAQSDLLLTLPERVARIYAKPLGLRILPPPLAIGGFRLGMFWHPRVQRDPAHAWLRETLASVAAESVSASRRGA